MPSFPTHLNQAASQWHRGYGIRGGQRPHASSSPWCCCFSACTLQTECTELLASCVHLPAAAQKKSQNLHHEGHPRLKERKKKQQHPPPRRKPPNLSFQSC